VVTQRVAEHASLAALSTGRPGLDAEHIGHLRQCCFVAGRPGYRSLKLFNVVVLKVLTHPALSP
jgi:hypothetical protein